MGQVLESRGSTRYNDDESRSSTLGNKEKNTCLAHTRSDVRLDAFLQCVFVCVVAESKQQQ